MLDLPEGGVEGVEDGGDVVMELVEGFVARAGRVEGAAEEVEDVFCWFDDGEVGFEEGGVGGGGVEGGGEAGECVE